MSPGVADTETSNNPKLDLMIRICQINLSLFRDKLMQSIGIGGSSGRQMLQPLDLDLTDQLRSNNRAAALAARHVRHEYGMSEQYFNFRCGA